MKEVKQTENGGGKMTLEEQIKYYRKQAGLSQEKMAEKSHYKVGKWNRNTGYCKSDGNSKSLPDISR